MLFRRKTRRQRMANAARRFLPTRRTVAKVAGTAGLAAGVAAASSSVSSMRSKQA